MQKFLKSSFAEYKKTFGGWITGSFFPTDSPLHSNEVEIRYGVVSGSEIAFPPHYHTHRITHILVTRGELTIKLDGQLTRVAAGEFVVFWPGVTEEGISARANTELIIIRTPSLMKEDKVEV